MRRWLFSSKRNLRHRSGGNEGAPTQSDTEDLYGREVGTEFLEVAYVTGEHAIPAAVSDAITMASARVAPRTRAIASPASLASATTRCLRRSSATSAPVSSVSPAHQTFA
jgi:hypothetical protein